MQSLSKQQILEIRPGTAKTFVLDTPQALKSAQVYVYQVAKIYPRENVERYRTQANYEDKVLLVEAVAKEPQP